MQQTTVHLRAAAALKTAYNANYASAAELLRVLGRNSAELPSADGAYSFFRELERFAQNSIAVPAVYSHLAAAA
jgi:hypothetical protein